MSREMQWHLLRAAGQMALAVLLLAGCSAHSQGRLKPPPQVEEQRPPNIVLIVADDLGWTDLGSYGSTYYETPNIDRLVAEGMRFTAAYANPNCTPTRAALMTGRYGARTGVYTVGSGARGLERFRLMTPVDNITDLALEEITFPEVLRGAGYATTHIGKWHLGGVGHLPEDQGFDVNVAGNDSGSPRGGHFSPYENPQLPDGPNGEYLTDRLAAEAVELIHRNAQQPFLLYLPFYAVHTPIQAKPDLIARYKTKPDEAGHSNPEYAAMIDSLDQGVGRVLAALDEMNLTDSTVVFFYSDNGGVGGYSAAGVSARLEVTSNAPLRGGKGMLYEGGVRVPLIARIPGVTPPGSTSNVPVMCVDFFPTLLEIAGAELRSDRPIDGVSFHDVLRGMESDPLSRPPIYWHFPGYLEGVADEGQWRTTPAGAIRAGHHKLIEFFETGTAELYDLEEDIGERNNLAESQPELVEQLRRQLEEWRLAVGANMPAMKP
ncbi:MAG: sulfatase-like hydrolase/transferase [Luteitalea sp.]|nr:sulfatase-like hydrolase/transferase [Luteitalea sp.]